MSKCLAAAAALVFAANVGAANLGVRIDEGFASAVEVDANNHVVTVNHVTKANRGEDIAYWIQWSDRPKAKTSLRCVIRLGASGDPIVDETEVEEDASEEMFTVCGTNTDDREFETGTYYFTQYVNGEKVGEKSIAIESHFLFSALKRKTRTSLISGAFALVLLGCVWIYRRQRGEKVGLRDVLGGKPMPVDSVDPVVIGSKIQAHAHDADAALVKAAMDSKTAAADQKRKAANLYQTLIAQGNKAKGVEAGRAYISQLVKSGDSAEAVNVFKECLAADPTFRLGLPEEVLPVAKAARAAGDPNAAIAALRGFDKAYPGHELVPDVYVFSAKLMAEELKNPEMARKILQHVVTKYPGHYLAQDAKKYLQSLG